LTFWVVEAEIGLKSLAVEARPRCLYVETLVQAIYCDPGRDFVEESGEEMVSEMP